MIGEGKQIPDDIRLFLRAVLMSSPGLKQPTLMNEYFEITGEQLNFRDYGFNNLYEFLVSLEGEVTRIEFSPIHGENLIYAVPDKDKYLSKHAEKYANKKGSHMKGKSPEEILEWKKEHKWKVKFREKSNKTKNRAKRVSKVESKSIKVATSINEWFDLRKLLPNAEGLFCLKVNNIGKCQRNDKSLVAALRSHFANYNILRSRIQNANPKFAIVSFAKYFSAYAAWKEKDCSNFNGCKIGIEPVGGTLTYASNTGIHKVIMTQMPKELLMSTLVAQFVKYPSLIFIDPHPREQYVVVGYLSKTSAEEACRKIKSITVNDKTVSVDVRQLEEKSIHFTTFNSRVKANESKFLDLPSKKNLETAPEMEIKDLAFHMFTKIRSKGLTVTEISDEIEFIITHAEDPCTFWGWIMNESNKIFAEMEEKIPSIIREIQKENSLPKNGDRGVALYKDEESKSWYRCYALSSDEEKDTVSVFFCDYGNCANIQKEDFLLIDEGIWSLPPQVFLFKFYDIDFQYDRNSARCVVGKKNIYELLHGHPMKAKVMKTSACSEPHIIEIKDVRHVADKDSVIIDDKIYDICCRSFEKPSETDAIEDSESKIDVKKKDLPQSLFDYDEDELVLGRLLEAYNPNLLFLTLDDIKTFSTLEIMLEEAILHAPVEIQKGDVLILCTGRQRRRVLILQLMKMYNAMVLHVDYGVIEWTSIHNLYQLPIDLQSVRFQARCASLAGIDCSEKMSEAVEFIKGKSKIVLKANVLRESSIGKISVELFDVNSTISLNKEMVEKQLAVRVYHEVGDTDEEFSSFVIPVEVKDHISRKPKTLQPLDTDPWIADCQDFGRNLPLRDSISHKELVSSLASLNTNSFTSHDHKSMLDCNRYTPQSNDKTSLMNIQTCIDPWEGNHSKILTKTDSEGYQPTSVNDSFVKRERCSIKAVEPDALYLPPDIDVTNKLNLTSLMNIQTSFDNSCWEGNCSKISTKTCSEGYQPTSVNDSSIEKKDRCCIKALEPNALYPPTDDETNKLNLHQTEEIRKKWITEKNTLLKIKDKLEMAMQMSSEELTSYYKEIKKEKLILRYNLKVSKALSEKLEAEYQDIVKEEIHILSLV